VSWKHHSGLKLYIAKPISPPPGILPQMVGDGLRDRGRGVKKFQVFRYIWVFPKIVVPQNGWFIRENPIKMMIWGYPYFWKHPHIVSILPSDHPTIPIAAAFLVSGQDLVLGLQPIEMKKGDPGYWQLTTGCRPVADG